MAKKNHHLYLLFFLTVPTVSVITVLLRTVALLTVYDPDARYFNVNTLPIVCAALLIGVAVVLGIFTHEMRDFFLFTADYRDLPTLFSGIFTAIVMLFFGVTLLLSSFSEGVAVLIIAILCTLASLGGAAHFVLHAFHAGATGTAKAMTALPSAALAILYALYLYFEGTMMLNNPAKVLAQCAWVLAVFFFLGEARIALGRAKWALHSYVTVMTAILMATLSLPNLIYHAVRGTPLLGNTAQDFLALALFLYTLARLFALLCTHSREGTAEIAYATDFAATPAPAIPAEKENTDEEATDR
ncbi:MAG: hypothetical protein J6T24_01270 [Clostridia bacterium]|nr:hypothetical protein [Clostridia bacterium]